MSSLIEETVSNSLLPRIALIACGSFSPPTPMHFRMFEIARDYFDQQGTHEVVGGIVSPTHDAYKKKGLAPGSHRCAMVKLALQTSSWIRASDWEIKQQQWSRTKVVLQHHQNYMNNYINSNDCGDELNTTNIPGWLPQNLRSRRDCVQLKLLCGADLLESFAVPGLWSDEDIEDIIANHGLVVISRSGANPEKFIFESDILTKYQRNISLVTNWVSNEVSSTMIRRLINRGQSVKYLIDDSVLAYIKTHSLFNYQSKYLTNDSRPKGDTFNFAYLNQTYASDVSRAVSGAVQSSSVKEVVVQEHMDETDHSNSDRKWLKLQRNLSKKSAKATKNQHGKNRTGPGQAVQVINEAQQENEQEEPTPAKIIKITAAHVG